MLQLIKTQLRRVHDDDRGVSLIVVVALMVFAFVAASIVGSSSIFIVGQTVEDTSRLQALAAAEAGRDYTVAALASSSGCTSSTMTSPGTPSFTTTIHPTGTLTDSADGIAVGCPTTTTAYVIIRSTGTAPDGTTKTVDAAYAWSPGASEETEGAIVSGGSASMNISTINVIGADGDVLINSGNFDCNNTSTIGGDLIIRNGTLAMSNKCQITGNVYVSGNATINNNAVGIGGSIYTLGNFSMTTGATIGGNVEARGSLTINSGAKINGNVTGVGTSTASIDNATIGGSLFTAGAVRLGSKATIKKDVVSSNTSTASDFYTGIVEGSVNVGGWFSQLAESTITGSVVAAKSGSTSAVAPSTKIGGSLTLGGPISTWSSGPTVGGTKKYSQSGLTAPSAPTMATPTQLESDYFTWIDYPYVATKWVSAGYSVLTKAKCDYQNTSTLVTEINALTTPTVVDATSCSTVNLYGVTFNLKTDVTFIGKSFKSAQSLKINSANGKDHVFNLIVPDSTDDDSPTCGSGQGEMKIYAVTMSSNIKGIAYSPCTISFGGSSTWYGQIYAGVASYSSGGTMNLTYTPVPLPGLSSTTSGSDSGSAGALDTTLLAQSED